MEDSLRVQTAAQPRRFIYRSIHPEVNGSHPMRRSTDVPQLNRTSAGNLFLKVALINRNDKFKAD